MAVLFGLPLADAVMTVEAETELLLIPKMAIAEVLAQDRKVVTTLAQDFSKYQSEYLTKTMQMPEETAWEAEPIAIFMSKKFGLV